MLVRCGYVSCGRHVGVRVQPDDVIGGFLPKCSWMLPRWNGTHEADCDEARYRIHSFKELLRIVQELHLLLSKCCVGRKRKVRGKHYLADARA